MGNVDPALNLVSFQRPRPNGRLGVDREWTLLNADSQKEMKPSGLSRTRNLQPRVRHARECSRTPLRRDVDKLREDVHKLMEGETT